MYKTDVKILIFLVEVINITTIDLFYRYGGHIELIRFKEYYRMPRVHEHISFVFSSALDGWLWIFGCNNDSLFPEKYIIQ